MLKINFQVVPSILMVMIIVLSTNSAFAQVNNVGIGTTTPDPSAILELQADDQGFLPPRMDQSGENALSSPAQGLMFFNTNINNAGTPGLRYYDGTLWNSLLAQKSTGEVTLFNSVANSFNAPAGSYYQFKVGGDLVYNLQFGSHTFYNESGIPLGTFRNDGLTTFYGTNSTTKVLQIIDATDIRAIDINTGGGLRNLTINDHLTVQANGLVNTNALRVHTASLALPQLPPHPGGGLYDVVWRSNDAKIYRGGSSSRRYKNNIRPAQIDYRKILDLEVKEYTIKPEYDSLETKVLGVIAEEADSLGLNDLVVYHPELGPDAIQYKKMGLYLLPLAQEQDKIIKKQEKQIADLSIEIASNRSKHADLIARLERLEAILIERKD